METSHKITAYLAIALGVVHQMFAVAGGKFNLNVLWFVGSGFAIIFAGFLNLAVSEKFAERLVQPRSLLDYKPNSYNSFRRRSAHGFERTTSFCRDYNFRASHNFRGSSKSKSLI